MPTKLLHSKAKVTLDIPATKKALPNTERLLYIFEAGETKEVEDYVADFYSNSYPNNYTIVEDENEVPEAKVEGGKEVDPAPPKSFDPLAFLENNPKATKKQLDELEPKKLEAICEVLGLKYQAGEDKQLLIDKIAQDIKVKNKAEKKQSKGE